MTDHYQLRRAQAEDQPFLIDMLLDAVNWAPDRSFSPEAVLSDPQLFRYVDRWPRQGELGVLAEVSGKPIGAAWLRFFTADHPGYGYVADDVPELSLAVAASWRGRGVGRALLRELAQRARSLGIRRISLSVERANFAHKLYLSEGYEVVEHGEHADTMVLDVSKARNVSQEPKIPNPLQDDLVLRRARPDDAVALAEIYLDSARHHLALDPHFYRVPERSDVGRQIRSALEQADPETQLSFVAELGGEVVGSVEVRIIEPSGRAGMVRPRVRADVEIAVRQSHRGRGVGQRLMRAAEDWARDRGAEVLTLDAHPGNEDAIHFYRQQGFRSSGLFMLKPLDEGQV